MATQNCELCVEEAALDPTKKVRIAGYTDPRDRSTRICGIHLTGIQQELTRDAQSGNGGLSKKRQRSSTFQGDVMTTGATVSQPD